MNRRLLLAWLVALGLPALLLPLVVVQLDPRRLTQTLAALRPDWLVLGILAGLIYQGLRAKRFGCLLGLRWDLALLATLCLQATARKLLPTWLGEAAGIWLFHRRHGRHPGSGSAAILIARSLDLAILATVLLLLVAIRGLPAGVPGRVGWFPAAALIGVAVVIALSVTLNARLALPAQWTSGWRSRGRRFLAELVAAVHAAARRRVLLAATLASALMWVAMYGQHYAFLRALRIDVTAVDVLWMQILIMPVQFLPIRGVADLGTHEAAWFAAALVVGLASAEAALVGVGTHLLAFAATGAYLLLAGAILAAGRRPRPQEP